MVKEAMPVARMTATRRKRLVERRERYEEKLADLNGLLDMMTESDVQSYTIGSRSLSRYKSVGEVLAAIEEVEKRIDEIDAALEGHRRKAVAVVIRDV